MGNYDQVAAYLQAKKSPGLACGFIYGLFGLDCEHGCRTEFHPAYAVAIQTDESKDTNTWAIFARNWGDEGFCSHLDHQLDLTSAGGAIRLFLPYNSSAPPTNITIKDFASSSSSSQPPRFAFTRGEGQSAENKTGESIEIPLPPPNQYGLTEVVVQFTWPADASPVACKSGADMTNLRKMLAKQKSEATPPTERKESPEEHMGRLLRDFYKVKGFSESKFREEIFKQYSERPSVAKQIAKLPKEFERPNTARRVAPEVVPALPPKGATETKRAHLPKHAKEVWDQAMVAKFCGAYEASGRRLPSDERELGPKLDKICSDKRLKP